MSNVFLTLTGLAGFARLCPGDQYEASLCLLILKWMWTFAKPYCCESEQRGDLFELDFVDSRRKTGRIINVLLVLYYWKNVAIEYVWGRSFEALKAFSGFRLTSVSFSPFFLLDLHAIRSSEVEAEGEDWSELQTELGWRWDDFHASHQRPNQHQGTVEI